MCSCAALYFVRLPFYGFKATGVYLELFLSRRSVILSAYMIDTICYTKRSVILHFFFLKTGGVGDDELSLRFIALLLHGLFLCILQ